MPRRGGHAQLFFESAIAIPQVKGAIPQSQCRNFLRNVAPQSQFFLKSATLNLPLESFTSAIFGIFWPWNPVDS
jgi:hypothetical protein